MPQVPTYGGQQVSLRPELQQGISVQATPSAFGADIGQGMQRVGQGLGQASDAVVQLRDFQDKLKAKDSLTAFEREKMQLDYGPNGYMTQQGANAAQGYSKYQADLEALKKKHASALNGTAAQVFDQAATDAVTNGMRSGIVHAAQGTKEWAAASSTARLATFGDQALAAYNKPAEIQRNIAAGFAEINEQGKLMGWGSEVLDFKKREFATGVHANVALAMASKPNGAGAAMTYLNQNAALIDTKTRLDMETKLKPYADEEQATSIINGLMSKPRASAAPAAADTAGTAGPTSARADLINRAKAAGKGADHVDGLDQHFATNLSSMFQDAPENIRAGLQVGSGYRSIQRQQELWDASDKTGKWVARPGGSKHNHGQAVDIWYNGQRLDKAPAEVREWVHANAGKYGLRFPMSYEPWHIEPNGARGGAATGSTVVPSMDTVAARSSMPSYDEAMAEINKIADPNIKAAALKQFNQQVEMRSKAETANQNQAKNQVWQMVAQGTPVSQIPLDLKIAAGREAISGFMEYETKAGEIKTDPIMLRNLTLFSAQNPTEFAKLDLTAPEIINGLSKADLKALTDVQATALTDERKARETGISITSAMSQAKTQLEAVGITSTGIATNDTEARMEMARREAMFQAELAREMQAYKDVNSGRNPNQMEIQSMINRMLLPVVMKTTTPGKMWGENTKETEGLFFENGGQIGAVAPGASVELGFKYDTIPTNDRMVIEQNLSAPPPAGLGRKPSEAEVVNAYEAFQMQSNNIEAMLAKPAAPADGVGSITAPSADKAASVPAADKAPSSKTPKRVDGDTWADRPASYQKQTEANLKDQAPAPARDDAPMTPTDDNKPQGSKRPNMPSPNEDALPKVGAAGRNSDVMQVADRVAQFVGPKGAASKRIAKQIEKAGDMDKAKKYSLLTTMIDEVEDMPRSEGRRDLLAELYRLRDAAKNGSE